MLNCCKIFTIAFTQVASTMENVYLMAIKSSMDVITKNVFMTTSI